LTWSLLDIGIITALTFADGGICSPAVFMYFLTLVFAALPYPLRSMVAVSVACLVGAALLMYAPTGRAGGLDPGYLFVLLVCVALAGVLSVWQARIQARQRSELARLTRLDTLTTLTDYGVYRISDGRLRFDRRIRPGPQG
jgi:hypothetical protein